MSQKRGDPTQWVDGRRFVQGQLFWATDKYVSENVKAAFGLEEKSRRPVIILQGDATNGLARMPVILVAPLTASGQPFGLDYALPAGSAGLKKDSVIQLSLIQPIPKKALEEYIGAVQEPHLEAIRERLARKFGLIGP